jgi:putative transposase
MAIDVKLIDELLAGYKRPEDIIGEQGLLKQLTKALLERAMQAEMTEHLGYAKHDQAGNNSGNSRNGKTTKALRGDFGEMPLETPRDRNGTFDPKIVAKGQTRFTGFDDKIVSMYARGMSTREITGHLEEIYGVEVSPALISNVTEAVMEEVKSWQGRPLSAVYPIVYLDALYVKIREAGHVRNRAIYVAIGVNLQGNKEVLGLWTGEAEGAKFWLQVLTDLKNRGVADIFIACVDGLTGFPKAIEAVFPQAQVQVCIVHQVRASLNYVSWKQRKAVSADLKLIYRASTADDACIQLEAFAEKWDGTYPTISQVWRRNWEHLTPFFGYPADIRKVI